MTQPVCVIVGAGRGNGAAFARRFTRAGHPIALLARNPAGLADIAAEIPGAGGYPCGATEAIELEAAFARIRVDLGPVGGPIYNAWTRNFGDLDDTDPDTFKRAWRVNALGCLLATRQAVADIRQAGAGTIVVIGATTSLKGAAGFVAFSSPKAAQRTLAQSMASQLGTEGIHVAHVVLDAMVDMSASPAMFPDRRDDFFAQPADIAENVHFPTHQAQIRLDF